MSAARGLPVVSMMLVVAMFVIVRITTTLVVHQLRCLGQGAVDVLVAALEWLHIDLALLEIDRRKGWRIGDQFLDFEVRLAQRNVHRRLALLR